MKITIPSVPHLVHIETTYACNQNCIFCYNPNRQNKSNFDVLDRVVESVYDSWIPHVYLIGGEPSLLGVGKLNEYINYLAQRSSVTIVTNGQIFLEGLSCNLACIGVPVHGIGETHDYLANRQGSFKAATSAISGYVNNGFDVRCIPVLTKTNFNQIYDIIKLSKQLGVESVFVDRFEDGGIGSSSSVRLKPSLDQFKTALSQMIKGRDDFNIPVGWGTAIPFCLDERIISENMSADCGAGITFCAINPNGDLRLCNQSERIYGNILSEKISTIWHKPELSEFRNLKWIEKPCLECNVLSECLCGCKVDANYSKTFCVDYAVREGNALCKVQGLPQEQISFSAPAKLRSFSMNRYTRLNTRHVEKYLVTQYQTIALDETAVIMMRQIISGVADENLLISINSQNVDMEEVRRFVSILEHVNAINVVRG